MNADRFVSDVIQQCVEHFLFPFRKTEDYYAGKTRLGMHFVVEVCVDNFGYEKDGATRREEWRRSFRKYVHIIVALPHRVYIAVSNDRKLQEVKAEEYINTSNHDSCWHSDGLNEIRKQIGIGYSYCYDHIPDEHRRIPLTAHINLSLTPLFSSQPFRFVHIERKPILDDKESNSGYIDQLESIKEVGFRIELLPEMASASNS